METCETLTRSLTKGNSPGYLQSDNHMESNTAYEHPCILHNRVSIRLCLPLLMDVNISKMESRLYDEVNSQMPKSLAMDDGPKGQQQVKDSRTFSPAKLCAFSELQSLLVKPQGGKKKAMVKPRVVFALAPHIGP